MVRSKQNKELLKTVSPAWEIVENIRFYLAHKNEKIIGNSEVSQALGINYNTLANFKTRSSSTLIIYVTIWCVNNNLDIRNFIRNRSVR